MDGLFWPKARKVMEFDREKFKRLVHYVIWRAGKRDWFGATKLNKVLWFSDTAAYALTGKSITGATYMRHEFGPVPKAIMPIRDELRSEGAIRIVRQDKLTRFTAEAKPDMGLFDLSEMATVDWWIGHIADEHTAASISDKSHDYTWQVAAMGEVIPMFATFAARIREPSAEEMAWGREAAAKLGLR